MHTENPLATDLFSTEDVAALCDSNFRRLDHYVRQGVLVPTVPAKGSGSVRRFDRREAQIAWVLTRISDEVGIADVTSLMPAAMWLRAAPQWGGMLVTNGSDAVVAEHAVDLLGAIALLGPAVTVVDLDLCPPLDGSGEGAS